MGNIAFAGDRRKVRSTLVKHGVSFEEAQAVFLDEHARLIEDPDHSERVKDSGDTPGWLPGDNRLDHITGVSPRVFHAFSEDEEGFLLLGYSFQARCLIVSHCYRERDSVIRLISATRATAQEETVHWRLR